MKNNFNWIWIEKRYSTDIEAKKLVDYFSNKTKPHRFAGRKVIFEDLDITDFNWDEMRQILKDLELKYHNEKSMAYTMGLEFNTIAQKAKKVSR